MHERSHSFDNGLFADWPVGSPASYVYANPEPPLGLDQDDNDVEEIGRSGSVSGSIEGCSGGYGGSSSLARRSMDLAMIAPSPVASPLLEFISPVFAEFTPHRNRRGLVDHFCNVLSHLIVFKEDTGNAFQKLVLPLSSGHVKGGSPVLDAIFALSSAHLENRGIEMERGEGSLFFHNRALQGLAMLIERGEWSNKEEVLGAIMLLVYYEVVSLTVILTYNYNEHTKRT